MNKSLGCLTSVVLTLAAVAPAYAQEDTRESAAANMRTVDPKEMDPAHHGGAAPFAQKLVDEALAAHPDVILLALHAGAPKYDIVASNFGRIGKLADEDDMRVITKGTKNLELNEKGNHFEDELPLETRDGKIIGAIGVVFNYKAGVDKKKLDAIAVDIQKKMAAQIASEKDLLNASP